MSSDMDEIVQEFLVESYEALDRLDGDLLALERDPNSPDVLASIFRVMHTIKGTCGFLGFQKLERVAHAAESLLGGLRDGTLAVQPRRSPAPSCSTGDVLRNLLGKIERSGNDGDQDFLHLVDTLERLAARAAPTPPPTCPPRPWRLASARPPRAKSRSRQSRPAPLPPAAMPTLPRRRPSPRPTSASTSVLDKLMNLVGELVLARNQIMQFTAGSSTTRRSCGTAAPQPAHDRAAGRRHEDAHAADRQRLGKFPRVVRDLAWRCGKQVRARHGGRDTELDRPIIEAIKDPLTHMVRNAVDHGIETRPSARAAGKPAEGALAAPRLPRGRPGHHRDQRRRRRDRPRAGPRQGDRARPDRRRTQAARHERPRHRSISSSCRASRPPTRSRNFSGRGVGMDVVKTNIEKIGGTVDVQSRARRRAPPQDEDPADARDHPGAARHLRRRALRASRRSTCSSSCAWTASRPRADRARSTARRSTGCAATCCRSSTCDRARRPGGRPDRGRRREHRRAPGRRPAVRPDRRRHHDTAEIVVKPLGST